MLSHPHLENGLESTADIVNNGSASMVRYCCCRGHSSTNFLRLGPNTVNQPHEIAARTAGLEHSQMLEVSYNPALLVAYLNACRHEW